MGNDGRGVFRELSYLLDTHTFLWAIYEPSKLSDAVKVVLQDPVLTIFVSAVTFWEISIKFRLGKLQLQNENPEDLLIIAQEVGFTFLSLTPQVASNEWKYENNSTHKDPFDRMLITQAIDEDLILLSKDKKMRFYSEYGLKTLWE